MFSFSEVPSLGETILLNETVAGSYLLPLTVFATEHVDPTFPAQLSIGRLPERLLIKHGPAVIIPGNSFAVCFNG